MPLDPNLEKLQWLKNLTILFAACLILCPYLADPKHWGFLDYANLAFHEAGHLIFWPFGDFLHIPGGTLGQLLVPAAFGVYFTAVREEIFPGLFSFFWFIQNFFGISVYFKNKRSRPLDFPLPDQPKPEGKFFSLQPQA